MGNIFQTEKGSKIEIENMTKIKTNNIKGIASYRRYAGAIFHVRDLDDIDAQDNNTSNSIFKDSVYLTADKIEQIIEELQFIKNHLDTITMTERMSK